MRISEFVKKYSKNNRVLILELVVSNIVVATTSLLTPYFIANFIDALGNEINSNSSSYLYALKIIIASYIVGKIFSYYSNVFKIKLHYGVAFSFNMDVINHIQSIPLSYFTDTDTAYLNKRVNDDVQDITEFIIDNSINFFIYIILLLGAIKIVYGYSIEITYLLMLAIISYIAIYYVLKKCLYEKTYVQKEQQNIFFSKLNEQFTKIKFIKINEIAKDLGQKVYSRFGQLMVAVLKFTKVNWLFLGCGDFVKNIITFIVLYLGGMKVVNGTLSIGNFVAMLTYFEMAFESIKYFLGIGSTWQNVMVSFNRISALMFEKIEESGTKSLTDVNEIYLDKITIAYEKSKNLFTDFSYKFVKGKTYCILGESGKGKSSLINSIIKITPLKTGRILFDNIDINDLMLYNLRKELVSFSDQSSVLLNDTVNNNLSIGCRSFNTKLRDKWIYSLGLKSFIDNLPEGYESRITDTTDNVSGGERQRLSIVRCLIKAAPVLILDEPTASLDVMNIERLKDVIQIIKKDKIIIIVTHNDVFSTIADEIITV